MNHHPLVVWFTGLSGSGKSTLARALFNQLVSKGIRCYLLDGDKLREGLNKNLGYSDADRQENIRRASEVAKLFFEEGYVVLCTFISPFKEEREKAKDLFPVNKFIEVFVNAPLAVCEERDVKGLYKKARHGSVPNFTGISSGYEEPENPEVEIRTDQLSEAESITKLMDFLLPLLNVNK